MKKLRNLLTETWRIQITRLVAGYLSFGSGIVCLIAISDYKQFYPKLVMSILTLEFLALTIIVFVFSKGRHESERSNK